MSFLDSLAALFRPEYESREEQVTAACTTCPFQAQAPGRVQMYTGLLPDGVPEDVLTAAREHREAFEGVEG